MQFEALEIFCDVARNRSFSQAALNHDRTQSAVSQMIAQLERKLGVQLIDRSTRPLQLTQLGKTYFDGCRSLLQQYSELESSLKSAQARVDGTVQIAAIYSVGLSDMGHYVEEFSSRAPNADVHIEYLHPDQVYEKVLDGSVDLGLVSFPKKMSKLNIIPWREEEMALACPPSHALAEETSVTIGDINELKFVHFSKELGIRREVDRFFRNNRVSVQVTLEFDNIENIKQAVEISAGLALLPQPTFRKEVAAGTLKCVGFANAKFVRPLGIIHRRQQKLTVAAQEFLDLLRDNREWNRSAVAADGILAGGTDSVRQSANSIGSTNGTAKSGAQSQKTPVK